ncbi:hypothetical protein Btru_011089 [Bulinus truncatus]|nr:hypothetical protein Btru_011089 [Bulinus truncatus]
MDVAGMDRANFLAKSFNVQAQPVDAEESSLDARCPKVKPFGYVSWEVKAQCRFFFLHCRGVEETVITFFECSELVDHMVEILAQVLMYYAGGDKRQLLCFNSLIPCKS